MAQAKKRTGIASTTDLIEFALANVANFSLAGSRPLNDTVIDHAEKRSL